MIEIRDMLTLDQAAAELGVAPIALFARASRGVFWTGLVGRTWVTTRQEVTRIGSEPWVTGSLEPARRHLP
jgi:hypothetical protein